MDNVCTYVHSQRSLTEMDYHPDLYTLQTEVRFFLHLSFITPFRVKLFYVLFYSSNSRNFHRYCANAEFYILPKIKQT